MEMYVYLQSDFVKQKPEAKAYYELSSDLVAFSFPEPGPLEGVCVSVCMADRMVTSPAIVSLSQA